jgi:hypothetical protein
MIFLLLLFFAVSNYVSIHDKKIKKNIKTLKCTGKEKKNENEEKKTRRERNSH